MMHNVDEPANGEDNDQDALAVVIDNREVGNDQVDRDVEP